MEARCQPTGNQTYAEIPYSGPRRLYQVGIVLLFIAEDSSPIIKRYNKLCGSLRSFAHRVSILPAQDPFRSKMEAQLLAKLYDMGVLNSTAKLSDIENKLTVAAFCRRRLAVIMVMSKMAETVSAVSLDKPRWLIPHYAMGVYFFSVADIWKLNLCLCRLGSEIYRTRPRQSWS